MTAARRVLMSLSSELSFRILLSMSALDAVPMHGCNTVEEAALTIAVENDSRQQIRREQTADPRMRFLRCRLISKKFVLRLQTGSIPFSVNVIDILAYSKMPGFGLHYRLPIKMAPDWLQFCLIFSALTRVGEERGGRPPSSNPK
jgi:hypothetical protein